MYNLISLYIIYNHYKFICLYINIVIFREISNDKVSIISDLIPACFAVINPFLDLGQYRRKVRD